MALYFLHYCLHGKNCIEDINLFCVLYILFSLYLLFLCLPQEYSAFPDMISRISYNLHGENLYLCKAISSFAAPVRFQTSNLSFFSLSCRNRSSTSQYPQPWWKYHPFLSSHRSARENVSQRSSNNPVCMYSQCLVDSLLSTLCYSLRMVYHVF